MKISQIGEDPFIQMIKERMNKNLPKGVIGIEDDCAVIPYKDDKLLLLSSDSLVEGCHFLKDKISPEDLGYKAVMVNVSDIAAMGGEGLYLLMSIAMPSDVDSHWLDSYLDGIQQACEQVGLFLIGGDTTGSKNEIFINFTIIGEVNKSNIKYRKGAKIGDKICLTAPIGDSLAGFHSLMEGKSNLLTQKHCKPQAQYREGLWLGKQSGVHAMMDLSDGLYQDLARMMQASDTGAEVILEQIPMSNEFLEFSKAHNWNAAEQAIVSGEEYCLLLTVESAKFDKLNNEFTKEFSYPLYEIGTVKNGKGITYLQKGQNITIQAKPYLHFKEK